MSVLDELRNMLTDPGGSLAPEWVLCAIDVFEAAHPGLVDLTVTCRVCGGKMSAATVENDGEVVSVAWGNCPACAKATP